MNKYKELAINAAWSFTCAVITVVATVLSGFVLNVYYRFFMAGWNAI